MNDLFLTEAHFQLMYFSLFYQYNWLFENYRSLVSKNIELTDEVLFKSKNLLV